jgi:osmotically-inducible protein OsmY
MNSRIRLMLALFSTSLTLQGCQLALLGVAGGVAYTAIEDRRSSDTQIDDQAMELRAHNRLGERFGDKAHVNVTSYNRAVLVTGEVPDEQARAEVEKIVLALPSVRGVSNEVQVAGPSSLGARTSDSAITLKVKARYLDSKRINPVHVKVVTEAAVVYLLGIVTEKEAEAAVEIARTTGGVRKVVKLFEYCQPADEICRGRTQPPKPKPAA